MTSFQHLAVGVFCFALGIASFDLCDRLVQKPTTVIERESVFADLRADKDPSEFYQSIMGDLERSVNRTMIAYTFRSALCTCPSIVSHQQSYKYGTLYYGGEFIADVYIAEATSTHDAYSSIQKSRDGSDYLYLISRQFEMAWFNTSDARHLKVLIRFDRFLIQISGEANAVEALSNALRQQLPIAEG